MSEKEDLSFSCFADLPTEIQLLIWELSLPDASVIHLTNPPGKFAELYEPLRSTRELSRLLYVCRDSREVFKRHYVPLGEISKFEHEHPIYFDPEVDTLYLEVTWHFLYRPISNKWLSAAAISAVDDWTVKKSNDNKCTNSAVEGSPVYNADKNHLPFLADKKVLNSIRHLAMDYRAWSSWCSFHHIENIINFFPNFPNLEKFTFVFGEPGICDGDEETKYPLELGEIQAGTATWPYIQQIKLRESKAQEQAKKKQPGLKLPQFEVKIPGKLKRTLREEYDAEWDAQSDWSGEWAHCVYYED
jgi:hypothetical protein